MSTQPLFEKHKEAGRRHEENTRMWLEDASSLMRQGCSPPAPDGAGGAAQGSAPKTVRLAIAQQHLAVREYKEAARLRPRDAETRELLVTATVALRRLQSSLVAPQGQPLRRFLAHYNLSIRYWDLGKGKQALAEAERACQELRKANLPCGCAEHNLVLMAQLQAKHSARQRQLQEATKRAPEAIGPNYDLTVLYFDKRMLLRTEAQLRWVHERARAASALQLVETDRARLLPCSPVAAAAAELRVPFPEVESKKVRSMNSLLEKVEDDLVFVGSLRELWCVEEETGKADELQDTGVRDGTRPHLLPCLRRRFWPEEEDCHRWWADICRRADFSQRGPPPRKGSVTRRC